MTRRARVVAVGAAVVLWAVYAHADDGDDFLRLLEAQNRSIASFEIRLRRVSFKVGFEDYDLLKKTVEEAARRDQAMDDAACQWAEELVQKWSENPPWITEHTRQRGDCFKHVLTSGGGKYVSVRVFDGSLHYDYSKPNRQLDIQVKVPNIAHADLTSMGLILGNFRQQIRLVSLEQDQERTRCAVAWSEDDSSIVTYEYDHHLGLHHSYESAPNYASDNYYLFHRDVDGYRIPRVHVRLFQNARRKESHVAVYIIEEVKFNCPLTDQDLSLDELPGNALVIDYRFEPSRQWRYGDYRQAAANPQVVHTGQCQAEEFVAFLHRTSGEREAYATRNLRVGCQAPRLDLEGWPKALLDLDDWPPKKFTVLNFWSMGCGFCVREVPENEELAQWLEGRGALFVTIHSAWSEQRALMDFLNERRIRYLVGFDKPNGQAGYWGGTTFASYGITAIPAYVTIAKDGRVLSYDRSLTTERLGALMAADPEKVTPQKTTTQQPTVIPTVWLAHDLEPQSEVEGRFFVYRPESPDVTLRRADDSGDAVGCQWTRHSADGQTVYDVRLAAKAPDWGKTLEGRLTLVVQDDNTEEQVTIPYELCSKGLVEYISPLVWLGCVEPGATVTRVLPLRFQSGRKIEVSQVSVPAGLKVHFNDDTPDTISLDLAFSSCDPGPHQGKLALLAHDGQGHHQPIDLEYCAFVQKRQ